MNDIDYLRIIKWILIVLLAGFIGQFGKSFAKYLMERTRRKKEAEMAAGGEFKSLPGASGGGSGSEEGRDDALSADLDKEVAKKKKKELKAQAKIEKKEAKAAKKENG
jgi:hypothetical protein